MIPIWPRPYKAFLAQALDVEWRGRYQHGVESRLKQARFPWVKTVDQFDFAFQPSIDRKVIRELAGLSFLERTENVVLLGPPGVGKTHLGIALGVKAVEAGFSVLFLTFETLMTRFVRARHENRLERTLQQLVYPRLLILDELGYLPLSREEASLFFRLLVRRYERASLLVTSNKSFGDWGRRLQRSGAGHGDSRPPPASRDDGQHQRRELSAARKEESRPTGSADESGHGGRRGVSMSNRRRCGNAGSADLGHLAPRDAHIPTSASSSMTGHGNR